MSLTESLGNTTSAKSRDTHALEKIPDRGIKATETEANAPATEHSATTSKAKEVKPRKKRDPNEPKKPKSAYQLFANENMLRIRDSLSADLDPNARQQATQKASGEEWRNMDAAAKEPYVQKYNQALVQYEKDFADYNKNKESNDQNPSDEQEHSVDQPKAAHDDDDAAAASLTQDPVKAPKTGQSSTKPAKKRSRKSETATNDSEGVKSPSTSKTVAKEKKYVSFLLSITLIFRRKVSKSQEPTA